MSPSTLTRLRAAWAGWTCNGTSVVARRRGNASRLDARRGLEATPALCVFGGLAELCGTPRSLSRGRDERVARDAAVAAEMRAKTASYRSQMSLTYGNVHVTNGSLYKRKFSGIVVLRVRWTPVRQARKSRNKTPPFPRNTLRPRYAGLFFAPSAGMGRSLCTASAHLRRAGAGCGIMATPQGGNHSQGRSCRSMSR
jgi:hypothetical protein